MGRFTELSLEDARRLAEDFGVDVAAVEALDAGSVNSNFRLTAADGRVLFARVYEEQGPAGAVEELGLLERLHRAGVPTTPPLPRRREGELPTLGEKPFALYPWVEGEILCQARVTAAHAAAVGHALATMHAASPRLEPLPQGRFNVGDLEARLDRIEREGQALAREVPPLRERLRTYASRRSASLPQGLVHGDLFRDNVLWDGPRIAALIDFESASRGPFVYDVMVCILSWCYGTDFDLQLVRALVEGYDSARALGRAELDAARTEGALACLRFAVTRITDFSMRAPPGEPPKRDFRRFLQRLERLEAGVLDGVLAGAGGRP